MNDEILMNIGPKICILGCSNSGKSTLATTLSQKLNVPAIHLDILAHKPNSNWVRQPDSVLIAQHNEIIQRQSWIIDGNYSVCLSDRLMKANTVIWLDFNPWVCALRYIRRSLQNNPKRPGKLQGSQKEFGFWLLKHILLKYPKRRRHYQNLLEQYPNLTLFRIYSQKQLKVFLNSVDCDE